ncbi:DsbA family protein [Phytohabitans sp. ZYX-F-186]|uniref:DsbA family protein n=1 Tax=Phytohabitans maris TaxID=3071409 RepID=A0ABU0ZPD6_9ACTN|nr:DsbA family protein [Phytohabitans sp. ZYX-F-186]MDQ7908586.1 DsbA family protein [Phytohabitans sp. ZYX-F-186]
MNVPGLTYVFDGYCAWSYGFAQTMVDIASAYPEIPVEVLCGGLYVGSARVPIRRLADVPGTNRRIAELTGAWFGDGYERLTADGSFVMNSTAAARGFAALRRAAPDRTVELAAALQEAFFVEGRSLAEPETHRWIAGEYGLDGEAVVAGFDHPWSLRAAEADFARVRRMGVAAFPTLLVTSGDRPPVPVMAGSATARQVEERLSALLSRAGRQAGPA